MNHISAVTFAVKDMERALEFYEKLGFDVIRGGFHASFSTLQTDNVIVNLIQQDSHEGQWWGRGIFRVEDVGEHYKALTAVGLTLDAPPHDASWGERFFHVTDLDGHELSFVQLLPSDS